MIPPPRFTADLFRFLTRLKDHNDRAWFLAHRAEYVEACQRPFLAFIRAAAPGLLRLSPHLVVSAKPIGGSMFKLHRDVRFTKDKRPFHTRVAARFLHAGCDGHGPGFYLHLEPGDCSAGCGIWRPDAPVARKIRERIVERPADWTGATRSAAFRAGAALWGESLVRPPAGFPKDHPLLADLKRKDFIGFVDFTPSQVRAADFLDRFLDACRRLDPLNRFLAAAVGLPWDRRVAG